MGKHLNRHIQRLLSLILAVTIILTIFDLSGFSVLAAGPTTYTSLPNNYEYVGDWSGWINVSNNSQLPTGLNINNEYVIERRTDQCYHILGFDINGKYATHSGGHGEIHVPASASVTGRAIDVSFDVCCTMDIRQFVFAATSAYCSDFDKSGKYVPFFGYRSVEHGTTPASLYWNSMGWDTSDPLYAASYGCWYCASLSDLRPGYRDNNGCGISGHPNGEHYCQYGVFAYDSQHNIYQVRYRKCQPKEWYVTYNNTNGSTGTQPKTTIRYNQYGNLSSGEKLSLKHSVLLGWTTNASIQQSLSASIVYSLGQRVYNLVSPGQTLKLYAVWRPWYYYVRYHSNVPGETDKTTTRNNIKLEWDVDKIPMGWTEASSTWGFTREGYYIESWSTSISKAGEGYTCANPYSSAGKSKFKNLANDTKTADLYAIWKGNPYKIVIHDNYRSCACTDEIYNVNVGEDFLLPNHVNSHGSNAKLLGYSYMPEYTNNPQFAVGEKVRDLTLTANSTIHLYRIWDEVPVVTSPASITFDRVKATAAGVTFNSDGTVKQSDLEVYLMEFAAASDYEYTRRYGTNVPAGVNNGYTFKIGSIDPVKMQEDLDHVSNYIITYICVDDTGNWSQAQSELFFGDLWVTILKDTN